ncbi:hypothetical protein MUK42_35173 [Musa troglodytarum]|uniref:Uncharacterized protein n=1 Tax=Musa troglodytarum TaxID=320322 RepID=A0A9E7FHL8_9LILI|nr:hypothetical protein MUK42_35173 [Musa troglodytarum]
MFRSTNDRPARSTATSRGSDVSPTAFLVEVVGKPLSRLQMSGLILTELIHWFRIHWHPYWYQLYVTIKLGRAAHNRT